MPDLDDASATAPWRDGTAVVMMDCTREGRLAGGARPAPPSAHRRRAAGGARLQARSRPRSSSTSATSRGSRSTTRSSATRFTKGAELEPSVGHPPQGGGVRHRRRGLQHRVRPVPDRDQPRVRRPAAGRRRHRAVQVVGEGDRAPARRARDLHVEAVPGYSGNGTHIHISCGTPRQQRLRAEGPATTRSSRTRR